VWGRCGLARAAPWVYDGGMSERLEKLKSMLQRQPEDAFLLYGTALEKRVIGVDPNYCYAYHQMGLIHESQGDVEAAKSAYRQGIEAANRRGDAHAREEISGALSMIE